MENILELLKNEKVEWKKLWEITIWDKKFNGVDKHKQEKIIKYKYYLANEIKNLIVENGNIKILTTNRTNLFTNKELIGENSIYGEIVCIPWGGNPILQYYKGEFITCDNRIMTSKDTKILNNKFLYYLLLDRMDIIESLYRGSGIKHPEMSKVLELEIPIPSLETQEKIVKILDKFTKYVTELQAELQARTKQYNYYRDRLLSEDYLNKISEKLVKEENKFILTTLGEIGKVSMCRRILKEQTNLNGEIPFYKIGTFGKQADSFISKKLFQEYVSKYPYPKKGDVLISASGTIGRTVIYNGEESYFQDSNIVWIANDEKKVKNKYLYYFYETNPWKISNGGTISRIYSGDIEKIKIALPSLKIQKKVVEVLDKFQELLENTKGLLPKEIEQRQKQYEYYREKLLTFGTDVAERERERVGI